MYDGVEVNGRYRITTKAAFCGKNPIGQYVTGWVDKKDIKCYACQGFSLDSLFYFKELIFQHFFDEIGYYKAQAITELLYTKEFITFDEYDELTEINRRTFSPMYADLLPIMLEKASKQS